MVNYKEIQMNQEEQEVKIAKLLYQRQQVHSAILEQVHQNFRRQDYQVTRWDEEGFLIFSQISLFVISKKYEINTNNAIFLLNQKWIPL